MLPQVVFPVEGFSACEANVRFDPRVSQRVPSEMFGSFEGFWTSWTSVGSLVRMRRPVPFKMLPTSVTCAADAANEPTFHLEMAKPRYPTKKTIRKEVAVQEEKTRGKPKTFQNFPFYNKKKLRSSNISSKQYGINMFRRSYRQR